MQLQVMGVKYETFDVYDYRGDKLGAKLESYLSNGNICAIVYSNPNNPSWICLREEELQVIGTLATKYDAIVMEDLAYFAMDFRKDLSTPFQPPYQATVARPVSVSVSPASQMPCSIVISRIWLIGTRVCPSVRSSPPVCSMP